MTSEIAHDLVLDEHSRAGIAKVLDLLLPGTDASPSGRDAGAHLEWLDVVLTADPALGEPVRRIAETAADHESFTVGDLERWAGDDLESVIFAVQAAYYMVPSVRAALGYPGQMRRPISQARPQERWSEVLIAPVKNRGAIYVPTPVDLEGSPPPSATSGAAGP